MITVKKEGVILQKTNLAFEDLGVFNPAIIQEGNTVHMLYHATRNGNYSTIGYCKLECPVKHLCTSRKGGREIDRSEYADAVELNNQRIEKNHSYCTAKKKRRICLLKILNSFYDNSIVLTACNRFSRKSGTGSSTGVSLFVLRTQRNSSCWQ